MRLLPVFLLLASLSTTLSLSTRRQWLKRLSGGSSIALVFGTMPAQAADSDNNDNGPYLPPGPEERSGLVVLRVAEVAAFQEKLIRAILSNQIQDFIITPQQIVFGTQILLRNSNLAGNLQLMIDKEVPRGRRREAAQRAAATMNLLQSISSTAAQTERPFTDLELLDLADRYKAVRLQLNAVYEYLPEQGKAKYNGYFMALSEFERKQAEGTYNPELDGVLRFEY